MRGAMLGGARWGVAHHVWKLDVGQAVDERLAEVRQLVQQRVVLLLDHLVLLLDGLQVGLHGGDLLGPGKPLEASEAFLSGVF